MLDLDLDISEEVMSKWLEGKKVTTTTTTTAAAPKEEVDWGWQ